MNLELRFLSGTRKGEVLTQSLSIFSLGRGPEQDVVVPDSRVSRNHARLEQFDHRCRLRDLDSTNGTFVNGVPVENHLLESGDQILVGDTLLEANYPSEHEENPSPPAARPERPVAIDVLQESTVEATIQSRDLSGLLESPSFDDFERLKTEHRKLLAVYKIMGFIASVPEIPELMRRILLLIFQVLQADRGFILVLDPESGELQPVAEHWVDRLKGEQQRLSLSHTIVNHVIERSESVITADATDDARFNAGESVLELQIRSAMCVPIRTAARVWGIIHVDTALSRGSFVQEDLELLTAIGQAAGMAVENAELLRQRLAEERLATIGKTIAGLSHYIKNILHGMRSGLTLIELGLEADLIEDVGEGCSMVQRYERRISDLVLNMLDYSKERKPDYRGLRLNHLAQELADLSQSRFDGKKVEFELDLDPDNPKLQADMIGLHRALLNIAINAVDAVEDKTGRITIQTRVDQGMARIEVQDNGCGIPEEKLPEIFEMFYSTKGHGGTGIGLAVTQKIVEEHGGRIEVESRVGRGTTFTVTIPVAPDRPEDETCSGFGSGEESG